MALFDEISKRVNGMAQSAQKAAEIARVQRLVNLKQDEFEHLYSEIGKLYYSARKSGDNVDSELSTLCERVDSIKAELDGLNLKLDDLKQIRRCSRCGSIQSNENRYCSACGEKLSERVIPAQDTVVQDAPAQPVAPTQEAEEQTIHLVDLAKPNESDKTVYIRWPAPESNTIDNDQE